MPAQRHSIDLEGRVAATRPSEFLPARLAVGRQGSLEAPKLLDPLDLGRGRWLLVLEDASSLLTSAVVEEGEGFRRARAGDGIAEELLGHAAAGRGRERFTFRGLGPVAPWTGEVPIEVDQSNESIIVGGKAVVKRFVWTAPGNERPVVLPAHLEAAGFEEMPAPLGNAGWHHADGVTPLVSMTTYLTDARDGWDWCVELVDRSLDDRSIDPIEPAAAIGAITARLHVALASPTDVLPSPLAAAGDDEAAEWRRNAEADLEAALSSIDGDEGSRLQARAEAIREELLELRSVETIVIPIHGDLHVGQFLEWHGGLAVSDLDGNPLGAGTLAGPPARDVASLVQSLDHVGRIVERRRRADVADWIQAASDACMQAYRGELTARGASSLFDERLVRSLRIAQELHEFVYAARFLPGWRYVPDRALAAILDQSP